MREIKFRGERTDNGKMIYGDFIHSHSYKGKVLISEERRIAVPAHYVEAESVAQFIGYDADGNEFYSDDTLIDSSGVEIPVEDLIIRYSEIGDNFYNFKLKE